MLKVQYITCEGTRAELHQIPASLWQMPEAGGRGSGGGGCGLDGEKIFEHLDQQAAAPPIPPNAPDQSGVGGLQQLVKKRGGWNR